MSDAALFSWRFQGNSLRLEFPGRSWKIHILDRPPRPIQQNSSLACAIISTLLGFELPWCLLFIRCMVNPNTYIYIYTYTSSGLITWRRCDLAVWMAALKNTNSQNNATSCSTNPYCYLLLPSCSSCLTLSIHKRHSCNEIIASRGFGHDLGAVHLEMFRKNEVFRSPPKSFSHRAREFSPMTGG